MVLTNIILRVPKIIFEDRNILIIEKPQGMPSQKDLSGEIDLLNWAEYNQKEKVKNSDLKILNRIDRPVGGLVLFGKTKESVKFLSIDIQNRNIKKDYLSIVCGLPDKKIDILKNFILKNEEKNYSKICSENTNMSKYAELSYKCLSIQDRYSLLNIRLKTGRHHQIRVQLSHIGLPIWGDKKYNKEFIKISNNTNIALWAYKLSFRHPVKKKLMTFYSFPPKIFPWTEFNEIISKLDR